MEKPSKKLIVIVAAVYACTSALSLCAIELEEVSPEKHAILMASIRLSCGILTCAGFVWLTTYFVNVVDREWDN